MSLSNSSFVSRFMPLLFIMTWSTGFIGAKFGLPYAEPLTFLSIRFLLVVTIMVLLLRKSLFRELRRVENPIHLSISGILIHGFYLGGTFVGISLGMEAGYSSAIVSLQPLLTAIFAGLVLRERINSIRVLGLLLGILGVIIILSEKTSGSIPIWWQALPLVVALLSISTGTVYQKKFCPNFPFRAGFIIQFSASFIVLAPLALFFETNQVQWTGSFIFALSWLVLVLSVGSISLMYTMMRKIGVVKTVNWFYLTPVFATIQGVIFFDERMNGLILVGMLITVLGLYLGNKNLISFRLNLLIFLFR